MAKKGNLSNLHVVTHFVDEEGNPLLNMEYREETSENVDESISISKEAQNVILSTGEAYNTTLSSGPRPLLMVGLCRACRSQRPFWPWQRRRKVHGLANARHLKRCCGCGEPVCPTHRAESAHDKRVRCLRCDRRHVWYRRVLWLFFTED